MKSLVTICCTGMLVAMSWIRRRQQWIRVLEGLTVIIVLLLALGSFRAAANPGLHSGIVIGTVSVFAITALVQLIKLIRRPICPGRPG